MTCKQCIHYNACKFTYIEAFGSFNEEQFGQTGCAEFEDKSRYIELPCAVGDTVYCDIKNKGKGYLDESIIKCVEFEQGDPEPLFTVICHEKSAYQVYWASEFGKAFFHEPHFVNDKKPKKHLKGARGNDL